MGDEILSVQCKNTAREACMGRKKRGQVPRPFVCVVPNTQEKEHLGSQENWTKVDLMSSYYQRFLLILVPDTLRDVTFLPVL